MALLAGCVNDVLAPQINAAAVRLLGRFDIEVVIAEGAGCCGALVHHLGRREDALVQAGRERVKEFTWAQTAAKTIEVYRRTARG